MRRFLLLAYEDWEPKILERIKLQDVTDLMCHWPYGDPFENNFRFCGRPSYRHHYCERHYLRAYQPLKPFTITTRTHLAWQIRSAIS